MEDSQLQKLKKSICRSFYSWIKLQLPLQVIQSLVSDNKNLLELIFIEMSNPDGEISQTETATDCIIQLLKIAKKPRFQGQLNELNDFLLTKVQVLSQLVQTVMQNGDLELGQLYQELFIEIGINHLKDIIESDSQDQVILFILLDLMLMGYHEDATRIQERIKARWQTTFWRDFVGYFSNFGSPVYRLEMIKKFQGVFLRLVSNILMLFEINPDETFEQFNHLDTNEEDFDQFFANKQDLGKILRDITKLIGVQEINGLLQPKLEAAVLAAQQD